MTVSTHGADSGAHTQRAPTLLDRFIAVRRWSSEIAEPLTPEDCLVQSMPDVSPTKWHLAHTTWFFETFVLLPHGQHRAFEPAYAYLFNSYYNAIGGQYPRPRRGLLSRPSLTEVMAYRRAVDEALGELLTSRALSDAELALVELGLQHEQQHQELMLTDIKHVLAQSPLAPSYLDASSPLCVLPLDPAPLSFLERPDGIITIGHAEAGFAFDNERPAHRTLLSPHALASRLVTVAEYEAFIADDGYRRPELWLSEGWDWLQRERVSTPLYWDEDGVFTLRGKRERHANEPVTHVSLYEADAYARWADCRLPTEQELEHAAAGRSVVGNFADSGALHPLPAHGEGLLQIFGDVWAWTQSAYTPYPGYAPPAGAIGEYNGKFMCNQHVLRGGSCVTPAGHVRASYRNFFPAHTRWQFTGIRLARDL